MTADDAAGIDLAVRHLAELGHTRIAHLAGPTNTSTGVARARAFRIAVQEHGLDLDPDLRYDCGAWKEEAAAAGLRTLLESRARFTAVVAGNDLIALGCYDVLAERGRRCPDNLSVIGFNNMPFIDKLSRPLTTVSIPHHQLGTEAGRLLLEAIAEPTGRRNRFCCHRHLWSAGQRPRCPDVRMQAVQSGASPFPLVTS